MTESTYAPGKYTCKIKEYGWCKAQTGTPQFFIQFVVIGKYDKDGRVVDCPHFERTFYRAISRKSEEARKTCVTMLKADLAVLDIKVERPAQLDPQQEGAVDLYDKEIDMHLTFEVYNGQTKERWSLRSSSPQKLSLTELRSSVGGEFFEETNQLPPPAVPPESDDVQY
jgi:hypothetical protein